MNEYAVVKVQAKGEHSKECLSPIVLKPQGCQPCAAKYFFNLAIARFMDLATARWLVPSMKNAKSLFFSSHFSFL